MTNISLVLRLVCFVWFSLSCYYLFLCMGDSKDKSKLHYILPKHEKKTNGKRERNSLFQNPIQDWSILVVHF